VLKKILINKKNIPVPVPVRTLNQALEWVDQTLIPEGHTITRITLDGRVLTDEHDAHIQFGNASLTQKSILELQIDSPVELAVQTIEAVHNLASVVLASLKTLAVECWKAKPIDKPEELENVPADIELVLELIEHATGLIDPSAVDIAPLKGIGGLLQRDTISIQMAIANSDWRAAAKILLNKFEPLLEELVSESESLQIRVMALPGSATLAKAGS
jgi:hypothetical protein